MKQLLVLIGLAWTAFVVESARPDIFPPGVLLLPLIIVGMLWLRTAGAVLVGGCALVLNDVLHPQPLPLVPVLLTLVISTLLSSRRLNDVFDDHRSRSLRLPEWVQILLLTACGLLLLTVPPVVFDQASLADQWVLLRRYLVIGIPLSLLMACIMQIGDEFGLRRAPSF